MTPPRTWIEPPAPPYHFLVVGLVCLLLTGCVTVALDCPKVATAPPGEGVMLSGGGWISTRPIYWLDNSNCSTLYDGCNTTTCCGKVCTSTLVSCDLETP